MISATALPKRVDRLEEMITRLTSQMERFALSSQKTNEYLAEHLAEVSNDLRRDRRNLNKRISEMSHKMGTMAEDLVAPSIPGILAKMVNCTQEPQMEGVRLKRRLPGGRSQEYDVVAVCGDYLLICEVKSNMRPEDIRPFRQKLEIVREFLPEFADKKVIGALATFYMDPNHVKHGERLGFIMLGVVDGLMQILNQDGFVPKAY